MSYLPPFHVIDAMFGLIALFFASRVAMGPKS